jgi:hypothetical protein
VDTVVRLQSIARMSLARKRYELVTPPPSAWPLTFTAVNNLYFHHIIEIYRHSSNRPLSKTFIYCSRFKALRGKSAVDFVLSAREKCHTLGLLPNLVYFAWATRKYTLSIFL